LKTGLYLPRATALHRLHPQVKLGLFVGFFACAFNMEDAIAIVPLVLVLGALYFWAEATPNVRRLRPLFLAVPIGSFVIWTIFYRSGAPLPIFSDVPLLQGRGPSGEGIRYAAAMALKLVTFLGASILFLSITRVEEFTEALRNLGLPYRVSFTIALAFRLVPLFVGSSVTVVAAQRARGLDFERGGVWTRLKRYAPVLVPVFMGALRRADGMAMALEARGFGAERPRTSFVRSRFGARDFYATVVIAAWVVAYFWAWRLGYGKPPA
jgi:energy-coupling factor transport system permease protein